MNRRHFRLIPVAAGLAAIAVVAPPADPAVAAPPPVTCQGPTCGLSLYQQIQITGDTGGPTSPNPLTVPPPPCWYIPFVPDTSAVAMAEFQFGADPDAVDGVTSPPSRPDVGILNAEILKHANAHIDIKANKLVFDGPPDAGQWFALDGYSSYGPAAQHCMASAPLNVFYVFVLPGQAPPVPPVPVPGLNIAEYVANHQTIPVPFVRLSQRHKGFVNLATYLWATWASSVVSHTMTRYVTTGTLGPEIVTVTSVPVNFVINLTGPGQTYTSCSLTPAGRFTGSRLPVGRPPSTSPGTPPDCGVLFTAPTQGASISVTITWQRSWTGVNTPDGNGGQLPDGSQTSGVTTIPVNEIQSINGSG